MLTRIKIYVELGMRESWRKIVSWSVAAACGSVVGGLTAAAVVRWLDGQPKIFGADWWDAFTAIGTVGAVLVACTIPAVSWYLRMRAEVKSAYVYAKSGSVLLGRAALRLVALRAPPSQELVGNSHLEEAGANELRDVLAAVSMLDAEKLSVVIDDGLDRLRTIQLLLGDAVFLHSVNPHKHLKSTVDELLGKAVTELQKLSATCLSLKPA